MKRSLPALILCIFLMGTWKQTVSQIPFFEKRFGSAKNDFSKSIKQLSDGSIYMAGYSDNTAHDDFDITLSKLDKHGNLLWIKYYGDTLDNYGFYLNTTTDGNFVICGEQYGSNSGLDAYLIKVDTSGNELWKRTYTTPANESVKSVMQTSDGGFILAGFQTSPVFSNDAYVIKTDSQGYPVWEQTYDNGDNDVADRIMETKPGEFILIVDTKQRDHTDYDIQLYKLDSLGFPVWDHFYGDSLTDGCQGVIGTHDNKYFFYGESGMPFDFILALIDSAGNTEWLKHIGSARADAAFSALEDENGDFIMTGYSNGYNNDGRNDLVVFKIDRNGNMPWLRSYGDTGIDIGYEIIKTIDNDGFLVTGKSFNTITGNEDYYLLYVDKEGKFSGINEDPESDKHEFYPNPCADKLFLNKEVRDIKIVNIQGKLIRSYSEIKSGSIDLSAYPPGIYFAQLTLQNLKIVVKKLVIAR